MSIVICPNNPSFGLATCGVRFDFYQLRDKIKTMKKIDIVLAILTGLQLAILTCGLIKSSGVEDFYGLDASTFSMILIISLPILATVGLWVCSLIGEEFEFIYQIAKFFLIGVLATLFDLSVLNFLMWIFGRATGLFFSIFKGISFLAATIAKYWGNKIWAFEKKETEEVGREVGLFFAITLVSLGINVGIASFLVNISGPQFGLSTEIWANVAAIIAAIAGATWNFLGYKFIVFKEE